MYTIPKHVLHLKINYPIAHRKCIYNYFTSLLLCAERESGEEYNPTKKKSRAGNATPRSIPPGRLHHRYSTRPPFSQISSKLHSLSRKKLPHLKNKTKKLALFNLPKNKIKLHKKKANILNNP